MVKKIILTLINNLGLRKLFFNTPSQFIELEDWIKNNIKMEGLFFNFMSKGVQITEVPPVFIGMEVTNRFRKYYNRFTRNVFVATIPNGQVLGEDCNLILSPDRKILSNVSREFGAEGGKVVKDFSVFHSGKQIPKLKKLKKL